MSDFEYNTGYFYPLSDEEYQILNDVDFFGNDIVQTPFCLEWFGHNKYLVLSQTHSYGIENHEFGNSRPLTDNELRLVPMKFSNEFTKIKFQASKFKFVEYCYYNSVDCKDYYLESSKPKQSETMTLNEAIAHAKEIAATKCDECGKEHEQLAEWLQELQGYKDKTCITEDWLLKNGFEKREYDYLFCNDVVEVCAQCTDTEAGTWRVCVNWLDSYNPQILDIYTLGELRMFLSICGLDNLVNEFK